MGYKGKQNLTSTGYKSTHKPKHPTSPILTSKHRLYKHYKHLYTTLHTNHPTAKESIAINSIMSRTHMATKISSQQNRQLALLDIDKLLSLNMGTIREDDARIHAMRLVVDMEGNRTRGNMFLGGYGWEANLGEGATGRMRQEEDGVRRRQEVRRLMEQRLDQMHDRQMQLRVNRMDRRRTMREALRMDMERHGEDQRMPMEQQDLEARPVLMPGGMPFTLNQFDHNPATQPQEGYRNAMGILRLVRAARLHYMRLSEQIANLGQQSPLIIPLVEHLHTIQANDLLQTVTATLPRQEGRSQQEQGDLVVLSSLPVGEVDEGEEEGGFQDRDG